jgi:hypothetical protein
MPAPAKDVDHTWYSVAVGSVTWLAISNYHDFTPGSEQYLFIKQALAAVDRTVTPWIFVSTHAPWYNTNSVRRCIGRRRKRLEERDKAVMNFLCR